MVFSISNEQWLTGAIAFDNAGVPLLNTSDWASPPFPVLELWAGRPPGLLRAGGTTPGAQAGGGQQQPGAAVLVPLRVQGSPEVPWLGTSASRASVWLRWQQPAWPRRVAVTLRRRLLRGARGWGLRSEEGCSGDTPGMGSIPQSGDGGDPAEEGASAGVGGHASGLTLS